jgi:ubiquinone/menaquinone biosynthesis C-methylase UbiE
MTSAPIEPTGSAATASPYEGLANGYNDARPSYPDAAIAHLSSVAGLVADIGAGTGIFTRQLACLLPQATVVGIEPSIDMRRMAEAASKHLDNISFLAGSAEELPFADGAVALMSAATAVHWFDRPVFYAEAFRCIEPGGRLVILQNVRRWWASEWLTAYEELHESTVEGYRRGTFPAFDGQYRSIDAAAELSAHEQVSSVTSQEFEWRTVLSEADFVRFSLSSTITQRGVAAIGEAAYLERLTQLIRTHAQDGVLLFDYVTRVVTATRADDPAA